MIPEPRNIQYEARTSIHFFSNFLWKIFFANYCPRKQQRDLGNTHFEPRAAGYYNMTHTSGILVNTQAGFSVTHHLVNQCFFAKNMAAKVTIFMSLFAISFNFLPIV